MCTTLFHRKAQIMGLEALAVTDDAILSTHLQTILLVKLGIWWRLAQQRKIYFLALLMYLTL
jgi:hypothetical protein